jgi:hypothetical protein
MNYGTLTKLGSHKVEGYYQQSPTAGQPFVLHGNPTVGDILIARVDSVHRVPEGLRPLLPALSRIQFPPEARPGDFLFLTSQGPYLLQPYRRGGSGNAA